MKLTLEEQAKTDIGIECVRNALCYLSQVTKELLYKQDEQTDDKDADFYLKNVVAISKSMESLEQFLENHKADEEHPNLTRRNTKYIYFEQEDELSFRLATGNTRLDALKNHTNDGMSDFEGRYIEYAKRIDESEQKHDGEYGITRITTDALNYFNNTKSCCNDIYREREHIKAECNEYPPKKGSYGEQYGINLKIPTLVMTTAEWNEKHQEESKN